MADTTIRRSIAGTIGLAALSLASAAGAIALFADGNWWGIALVLIAGGAGLGAYVGPQRAKCPHCGASMSAESSINHCKSCGQYASADGGALVKLAPDYIDANAIFAVSLHRLIKPGFITGLPTSDMRDIRWPTICMVCNAPATAVDPVDIFVTRSTGPTQIRLKLTFPFPRCESHRIGADIDDHEVWHGDGFACDHAQLRFKSHRFWREFCRLNTIDQRRAEYQS